MTCFRASLLFVCMSLGLLAGYAFDPVPVSYRVGRFSVSYGQHEINQETLAIFERALRRG